MERITCEYCGTEFDASEKLCPLCGRAAVYMAEAVPAEEESGRRERSPRPGKRLAKPERSKHTAEPGENPYAIPKGLMIAICVILALAVLLGAAFAIYNLKWFDAKESPFRKKTPAPAQTQPQQQVQPAEQPTVQPQPSEQEYTNEEDYAAKNPDAPKAVVECRGLSLSKSTVTFEEPETFCNITYIRLPDDCTQDVIFASSDEAVVTVNQQGKIMAVDAGTATVTAVCGKQIATCLVTCDFAPVDAEPLPEEQTPTDEEPELPPELNMTDMTFFSAGEQFQLVIKNLPDDVLPAFSCSNPDVATVSPSGLVTAVGAGTTTVTATLPSGQTLSTIVRCNISDADTSGDSSGCTISHSDVTMSIIGEYFKIYLKDRADNTIKGVSWVSSDPSVCSVDANGVVTAVGKGTAYVSASYGGETFECIVRCNIH